MVAEMAPTYTFADMLRIIVATKQAEQPDKADAIGRAHAAIQDGHVVDLGAGHGKVLAKDGTTWHQVNGSCDCTAASYGKRCHHLSVWELYQEVHARYAEQPEETLPVLPPALSTSARALPSVGPLPLRPISAIIADLSRPLPAACVATKTVKGQALSYLHWQTVARLLDTYAPGWQGEITRLEIQGQVCRVTYRLHLPCAEGVVWREASGEDDEWEADESTRYGNPSANAQANAFKRAAALFGCGQWLYDKRDDTGTALAAYLRQEKQEALIALGHALIEQGLDRAQALTWLKRQAGVTALDQIPLATLRTLHAALCQQAA